MGGEDMGIKEQYVYMLIICLFIYIYYEVILQS
jgi:hypothetical protein